MKGYQVFIKTLNLIAIVGYILNVAALLEGQTSRMIYYFSSKYNKYMLYL